MLILGFGLGLLGGRMGNSIVPQGRIELKENDKKEVET
jgi:hypothetical protein